MEYRRGINTKASLVSKLTITGVIATLIAVYGPGISEALAWTWYKGAQGFTRTPFKQVQDDAGRLRSMFRDAEDRWDVPTMRKLLPGLRSKYKVAYGPAGLTQLNTEEEARLGGNRQARDWFQKVADQGDSEGQFNLEKIYDYGSPQDYKQAMEGYQKAADQGEADAQNNLGTMYDKGHGVPQDYKQAMEWFRKAADQGNAPAQYNLGTMYDDGRGVPQDYKQAMEWYRKAADQGDELAKSNLIKLSPLPHR